MAFEQLELDDAKCQNDDQALFQRIACSEGHSVQNAAEKPIIAVNTGSLPLAKGQVYSAVTGA